MAAQSGGKTTAKKDTTTVKTSTASDAATGQLVQPPPEPTATGTSSATSATSATSSTARTRPAPSARSGIRLNLDAVSYAFFTGGRTRSVKAIQYALEDRGFAPGNKIGHADRATRDAFAEYQRSIGETGTGSPTDWELDYLGFDVI